MLYSSNILFMPLLELSPTKKNQQTSESYALPSETRMVVKKRERESSLNLSNFFIFMRRLLIWRSWGGVFGRAGEFLPVTPSRHCEFLSPRRCESLSSRHCESFPSRHCEERSDEAISPLLHPAIANRRVGKCAGVKQSPRCTFLLVLGVLGGLLRSLRSLAMTLWGYRLAMTRRWLAMAISVK